jgi:hypothetical protein
MMRRYGLNHPDQILDLPWYFTSRIDAVIGAVTEAEANRRRG